MERHPSLDIVSTLGTELAGKRIVLCISGSVAAVKSPEIARLLMRHGAEVFPVMSEAAAHIIHPDLMEWATGHLPVTHLSGKIEHVAWRET
jgi:phosphopantothenoylcysteine decarboxylase/phosphopantothenate--cysteine ligase